MMTNDEVVWARDDSSTTNGFILARITELLEDGVEITPLDAKHPRRNVTFGDIYQAGDYEKEFNDNCEMMYLNEATLLENVRRRYYKNKIYTYVANILIAVNPYKEIPDLYSPRAIEAYQGRSLGELPPHVFAIADKAMRDMRVLRQSQSIIVSGESGAGKTESTKHLLRYLCDGWAKGGKGGPIEQKILNANPILEAFGNAKTTRNNNSSRFGKFIQVHFDRQFHIVGGHISHYLLEKSRICSAAGEERGYHVFYMLMAGAPPPLREELHLTKPDDFNYLRNGCTKYFLSPTSERRVSDEYKSAEHLRTGALYDSLVNDYEDFGMLDVALTQMGFAEEAKKEIYTLVAAVLHLGNIDFAENPDDKTGGCMVATSRVLNVAAQLLRVNEKELQQALVSRVMQSSRGGFKGTVIKVPLKIHEARNARDALAKAIYSNLFDYIVNVINRNIPFQESSYYVGVLDIAGFEFFTVNSFEQFCINYCNEKLQQFFNETILKFEQELYQREGLNVPQIKFVDNQDCIDIIETKNKGIFNLLDEESKLPKPYYAHFTSEIHAKWSSHFRLALPRSSKLKAHRSLRDDEGFIVRHFAGAVCYQTLQFIEKNNDALHASLEYIIKFGSDNPFLAALFDGGGGGAPPLSSETTQAGKLSFISVGNKFKTQLAELMEKLRCNGTNFIRCIKPNSRMIDQNFEGALCLMQLKCSGMTSVLELMEHGYPSRAPFAELYATYEQYLPPELKQLKPRTFCEAMLHSLKLHERDYKFGVTRVFFRPGKFAEFDRIMRSDPDNLRQIITNVKKWLIKSRWLKSQFATLTVIKLKNKILYRRAALITIQKWVRRHLTQKAYAPRIRALREIGALDVKVAQLESVTKQLKHDGNVSVQQIATLKSEIQAAIVSLKKDPKSTLYAKQLHATLVEKVNGQMALLQMKIREEKRAEEEERLRRMQEEMERERELKAAEERRQLEEEENRRRKADMEARRKREEEERKKQEELDKKAAMDLAAREEREALEDRHYQQQLEQERQDHELALRLAHETNDKLMEEEMSSPPLIQRNGQFTDPARNNKLIRSEAVKLQQNALNKGKYDLSKWKYSELRDAINTSCDIELLEACRHEFHRRLKVYHAWKAKNRKRTTMDENERAPRSIMESASRQRPLHQPKQPLNGGKQRYFRIPFTRSPPNQQGKKGWWFAHFDGEYVARQMELHPEKAAVLLLAGKDDMQMCELSLEETGLTRKRGAEILEHEFCREWERNGGGFYQSPANRK